MGRGAHPGMHGGHGVSAHSGAATAAGGGAGGGGLGPAPGSGMGHMMGPPGHNAAGPGGMMSHGGNNGNSMGHNIVANSNPNANQSNNRAPPPAMSSNGFQSTPLGELRPNMKNVHLELIILHYVGDRRIAQDNQLLTTFIAADSTGCLELVIWGEDSRLLKAGDLLRVHSADTKLFKGKMQVTTTRHGKYKKFGEDILLFKETPNYSEFEWVQDPSHPPGVLSPLTNQLRMDFANRGIQPVPVGQMGPQRGGQQGSFNPSFRQGPPRQFQGNNPNNMPPQGGNMMGGGGMHKMGGQGFQGNNSNSNNSSTNNSKNGFGFHNQGPDHPPGPDGPHPHGQHDNLLHPQHHHPQQQQQQQQQQQPHQGPPLPQGGHLSQHPRPHRNFHNPPGMHGSRQFNNHGPPPNPNQGGHGSGSGGDGGNAGGGGGGGRVGGGGGGRAKFNKSKHRDLDAPTEAYPSPRSGLASSNDEFNRDISKLMNQGNVGLGMLPGGGGGGGGPGVPTHMRKKPKIESD
ncbi:hypothetical protein DFQ27_002403 [Actinomortierella ambigua]|uniref:Uncharacterized protein n=1 Tax=Actinomortierella ambigua TaxID=1343610 RepID=A0A9P6QLK3_9FUNG|nr:hypothetical protein DFQ27_002403 [Actinomortierella ambigua]